MAGVQAKGAGIGGFPSVHCREKCAMLAANLKKLLQPFLHAFKLPGGVGIERWTIAVYKPWLATSSNSPCCVQKMRESIFSFFV